MMFYLRCLHSGAGWGDKSHHLLQIYFFKSLIVFHKGSVEKLLVLSMSVGFFEVLFGSLTCAA